MRQSNYRRLLDECYREGYTSGRDGTTPNAFLARHPGLELNDPWPQRAIEAGRRDGERSRLGEFERAIADMVRRAHRGPTNETQP